MLQPRHAQTESVGALFWWMGALAATGIVVAAAALMS
jgi:hypothetical protein